MTIEEKVNQIKLLDAGMKHMQDFLNICKREHDGTVNTFNEITINHRKEKNTRIESDSYGLKIHNINKEIVDLIIPVIESHIEKTKVKIENLLK